MSRSWLYMLCIGLLVSLHPCIGQSEATIANTSVQLQGDQVRITYDILNADKATRFIVSVEVYDSEGNRLDVNALEGDIGEVLKGGKKKVVLWDPAADSIFLNAEIDIQVFAEMILPPPVVEPEPEVQAEERPGKVEEEGLQPDETVSPREFNRTLILLQSAALPGLGLTRMTGKPHWIKGVAGYGCVIGAIVSNKKAVASYDDYMVAGSAGEANSLYSSTTTQDNMSKVFAVSAIAVWVADLAWTFMGTRDMGKNTSLSDQKGVGLNTGFDVISNAPLLSFTYRF